MQKPLNTEGEKNCMANADKMSGVVGIGNSFFLPINANPNVVGVPGNTIIFFSFDKPGTYKVNFEYKRPC